MLQIELLEEDYEDYLESGGSLTFIGWLKFHHYDIYLTNINIEAIIE